MVVGTLPLVQKGQTSGCSMQWTQYAVNAVHSGCSGNSGIWWWGHCLGAKGQTSGCSMQWTQWTQWMKWNSGIWW